MVFPFVDPPNTAALICTHVLNGDPILYVSHDADDGMWQFLCGRNGHSTQEARLVSLAKVVDIDPQIGALASMPLGCAAERNDADSPWEVV